MTKIYIASTLTAPQDYTVYDKGGRATHKVRINGGNGLVNRNLVTLEGAITEVSEEDLELLKTNALYQTHVKNGFVKVTDQPDATKASSDLESRDEGAPMTQNDVDNLQNDMNTGVDVDYDNPAPTKTRKPRAKK